MLYIPYPSWIKPEIIPQLPVRWYGLMYLFAFVTAYLLFQWQIRRRQIKVNPDLVMNFFFWIIIGLLVGARLFSTLIYNGTAYYWTQPWLIFWPFQDGKFTGFEGMSFHGGVVGAVVAAIIYCRVNKISVLEWGDLLVHGVPLGYTFGRLGNFINGELYGKVSDAPWAMVFPTARPVDSGQPWVADFANRIGMSVTDNLINLPRHPSQLYEALFEGLVLWLVMWFVVRPRKPFRGFSIAAYMIGYGVIRFFIEYVRAPDDNLAFIIKLGPQDNPPELFMSLLNFSMGQLLSFLMVLGGVAAFLLFRRQARLQPKAEFFDTSGQAPEGEWDAPRHADPNDDKRKQRRKTRKKLK